MSTPVTVADDREAAALIRSGRRIALIVPATQFGPSEPRIGDRLRIGPSDPGSETAGDENRVVVTAVHDLPFSELEWGHFEALGDMTDSESARTALVRRWGQQEPNSRMLWIRFRVIGPDAPAVERTCALDHGLPEGYRHTYSGKVRELYATPGGDLLVIASDRISAYDWILTTPIPDKGAILTRMSTWWFDRLAGIVPNHLTGEEPPAAVAGRAVVCRRLDMYPVECVVRGYLTGSGLIDYRSTGRVCGIDLPSGLVDGSRLPESIFTPATKAAIGDHDQNVDLDHVATTVGRQRAESLRELSLAAYRRAHDVAAQRGIILADTKFEFGSTPEQPYVLADEVLTPDSSRFWPADRWRPGRVQPSFDKQFVRDWLTSGESGWSKDSDQPPPPLPESVVTRTRQRYVEAFERLTGTRWRSG